MARAGPRRVLDAARPGHVAQARRAPRTLARRQGRARTPNAMAADRLRGRHLRLFRGRARARLMGGLAPRGGPGNPDRDGAPAPHRVPLLLAGAAVAARFTTATLRT